MKKIFYMAAAALAFAACSKDDTDKIDTLTVTPETATVFTDGKLPELSIAGTPADALEGAEITWTSSNPEVVAVSADGKISFAVKDIAEEATVEISASACTLFREHPEMKSEQVSEMVGYNDSSNFHKDFKRFTGMSASQYRKLPSNS